MITINVSRPSEYYSQRNNEIRGTSACNVTSAAMFIETSEKKLPFVPQSMGLDDFLMATLIGKEGYEMMFKVADTLYPEYTPNEVHSCLVWAINRVMGKEIAQFRSNWSMETLLFSLVKGKPAIVSGKFGSLHHIVILVGFESTQSNIESVSSPEDIQLNKVKKFIIDDPWGDSTTDYSSHKGDDVVLTYREFIDTMKPQKSLNKWGHMHTDIIKLLN